MTERESLLAVIIASPDEDAVRLVCADWLDEHGEHDRAEFIRVQCELARASPDVQEAARAMATSKYQEAAPTSYLWLARRERELLRGDAWKWFDEPDRDFRVINYDYSNGNCVLIMGQEAPPRASLVRIAITRGFVHSVTCTAADWLAHGDAIRAAHPVREVTLTTVTDQDVQALADRLYETEAGRELMGRWSDWHDFWLSPTAESLKRAFEAAFRGVEFAMPATVPARPNAGFTGARRAGERAAMEWNRRVLDTILGDLSGS
jgi:uncharacterized protein (TIGR02996 family)